MASTAALDLIIKLDGADKAAKGLGSLGDKAGGLTKVLGGLALGGIAVVGAAFMKGVGEASEWENGMAQLNAVLTSTKGIAGQTADEIVAMSTKLSASNGMSKFSDDAVLAGSNILLTFTNIKDDVFPGVMQASVDMAQAMGTDVVTASMQLGKALNDPLKGMTKLTKQGVQFTDAQREQVRVMMAAGDVMGAQKVILGELATQFGGSASAAAGTFSGKMTTLSEKFNDLVQGLAEKVMPMLGQFIDWLSSPAVMAGIQSLADSLINGIGQAVTFLQGAFTAIMPTVQAVWGFFQQLIDLFRDPDLSAFQEVIDNMPGPLQGIATLISGLVANFGTFFQTVQEGGGILEAFGTLITSNFGTVMTAVGGLASWLITDGLPAIWNALVEWAPHFWQWIVDVTPVVIQKLGEWGTALFDWLWNTGLPTLITKLGEWGKALWEWVSPHILPMLGELAKLLGQLGWWIISEALPAIVGKLGEWGMAFLGWVAKDVLPFIATELGKLGSAIWTWITDTALPEIVSRVKGWAEAMWNWVAGVWTELNNRLKMLFAQITDWIRNRGEDVLAAAKSVGTSLVEGIKQGAEWAVKNILLPKLRSMFGTLPEQVMKMINGGSPALDFVPVGNSMIEGVELGAEESWPEMIARLDKMFGTDFASTAAAAGEMGVAIGTKIAPGLIEGKEKGWSAIEGAMDQNLSDLGTKSAPAAAQAGELTGDALILSLVSNTEEKFPLFENVWDKMLGEFVPRLTQKSKDMGLTVGGAMGLGVSLGLEGSNLIENASAFFKSYFGSVASFYQQALALFVSDTRRSVADILAEIARLNGTSSNGVPVGDDGIPDYQQSPGGGGGSYESRPGERGGQGGRPVEARAGGGPVTAGNPYWVGEGGPEMFVPSSHGSIFPNGGGGITFSNITINAGPGASGAQIAEEFIAEVSARLAQRSSLRNAYT